MAESAQRLATLPAGILEKMAVTFDRSRKPNWRSIIEALPKNMYSKQQIELFGMACLKPRGSPTKTLVKDLGEKGKTTADLAQYLNVIAQDNHNVSRLIKLLEQPSAVTNDSDNASRSPIVIVNQPISRIGVDGQEIEIGCEVVGEEPLTFAWFHGRDRLDVSSRMFRIRSLSKTSAGFYICRISNPHCYVFTNWACIEVVADPSKNMETAPLITVHPRAISCNINDEIRLFCDAIGNPEPDFQWYFNSREIAKETDKFFIIKTAKLSDSGLYSCVASNGYGTARTLAAHVNVSEGSKDAVVLGSWSGRGGRPSLNSVGSDNSFGHFPHSKVALLIGNQNYIHKDELGRLVHPLNDTRDIAAVLTSIGFTVVSLADLNLEEFSRAVSVFRSLLTDDTYGLFYFAGHGFEVDGENYLMPVDATPSFSIQENFPASKILDCMVKSRPKLAMMMLDCCRTTPESYLENPILKLSQALQAMQSNVVICFGCCSQSRVLESPLYSNGFFAEAFCKHVKSNVLLDVLLFEVGNTIHRQNIVDPATGRAQVIYRHSTLVERISLCDPVLPPSDTDSILQRQLDLWSILHQAPESPVTVFQNDIVKLDFIFSAEFSNVLLIQSQIHSSTSCSVKYFMPSSIGGAKVDILKDEAGSKEAQAQREVVKISNLELLKGEATIHIQLQYLDGEQVVKHMTFYTLAEQPLYAKINCQSR